MKNKKRDVKNVLIVVVAIAVIAVLFVLFVPKQAGFFYINDTEKIERIMMMNGNNGQRIYADEDECKMIEDYLSSCIFTPNYLKPRACGWSYRFIIESDGKTTDFVFAGDNCSIDSVDYKFQTTSETSLKEIWELLKESHSDEDLE